MKVLWVDHDFVETLGIDLIEGRNFSRDHTTDETEAFILNETATNLFGWDPQSAIGKQVELIRGFTAGGRRRGTVVGVVRDFHFKSLHSNIEPLVMYIWPWLNYILVQIHPGDPSGTLELLEQKWGEFEKSYPFEYFFLDDQFDKLYEEESRRGSIFRSFSFIAIFLSCLGLFSLASFVAEQRTKEIGVRKVFGATVSDVFVLLSKSSLKLVLLANLLAWPVAYYIMDQWLQDFAYRIGLGFGPFFLGGLLALIIAQATVSYQAVRAAMISPVDALSYR